MAQEETRNDATVVDTPTRPDSGQQTSDASGAGAGGTDPGTDAGERTRTGTATSEPDNGGTENAPGQPRREDGSAARNGGDIGASGGDGGSDSRNGGSDPRNASESGDGPATGDDGRGAGSGPGPVRGPDGKFLPGSGGGGRKRGTRNTRAKAKADAGAKAPVDGPASIRIDPATGEPKRGPGRPRGSKSRPKQSDANKRELVESMTKLAFGVLAMAKGPHWKATDAEMAEWSGDAARLFDRLEERTVERVLDGVSGMRVLTGIGGMVSTRVAMDAAMASQHVKTPAPAPPKAATRPNTPTQPQRPAEGQETPHRATSAPEPVNLRGIYA